MAKFIIDTDAGTVIPMTSDNGESIGCKIASGFEVNEGVKEYEGIVATIQRWFYGNMVKASWCATSMSYMMQAAGLRGVREENVNLLRIACKAKAIAGEGKFYDRSKLPLMIRRGDVCFWLFDGSTMTNTSKKHVNVCTADTDSQTIQCIGGNQDNKICVKPYKRSQLYAVYRV